MTPALSIIIPYHNRATLFARALDTYLLQANAPPYELVVVDDGSDFAPLADVFAHRQVWMNLLGNITVRVFRVDPTYGPMPPPRNPALAWNVGIRQAHADRVVITSPEIAMRSPHNLAALLVRTLDPWHAVVGNTYDREWAATEFSGWIGGGPKKRTLPFFSMYRTHDLVTMRGFEEAFMAGVAFDDNEFVERFELNGGVHHVDQHVVCEHLPHERLPREELVAVNRAVYEQHRGQRVANVGRDWGSEAVIVGRWP